ncbi:chromatin assembly factor 1 p150 subunit [Rhizoctonia solani AG-3 Rhs1AP]|uniref:Chromatin assembly factor 1 p150 subunit n=1 Tax=Rhizoctonia solani AG-3 Rhs1AP TaxID=1086054 RepID=X8J0W3_9AGAM|nr:chromatin assembly factor 1 p150 subunit [Rhizoctonia solani AG-3 Rhs1AP]
MAGPSGLYMPPPPQEMKASRKSARRAKSNIPPPQPVFPPVPPTAPEAPIHPIPYNNSGPSWHHKPGPILPEGWIPDADDEGHIDIPPAHEIHPSPLLVNNDLGERSQHPVIPNAPLPKTPKHRAGSQPTASYTPMVIPEDHYYDEDDEDDEIDIPIMHEPVFDPLAVRTPAHYGRPLSVIPELSPEYQPPPIPDAPLPSARHSTRSRHSQPYYRHEQDDHSATVSVESGADASVHRSIWRRPSSLTPTSPAPPVVQQHVQDDPRTPPPPIVPSAQIPVTPISPESVPPLPKKTRADRRRDREVEHARDQAWEREERERNRQGRERERLQRDEQQMELDRKMQEQRAREAYETERLQARESKEREREERRRERERKDSERERKEKEKDLKEQERERRYREREKNRDRDRTERRRSYNPTPAAPIVPPNPIVAPSPAPETSPHESVAPHVSIGRVPLSEDRQITFPMPHIVSPPKQIVGGPGVIVDGPSIIVEGPSTMVDGPSRFVDGPSRIVGGHSSIGGGPTRIGGGPTRIGEGPGRIGEGPSRIGDGPSRIGEGPSRIGDGPSRIGEGPSRIGEGPAHIGEGPLHIGEGPTYIAKPSERIVPPIIPPPPIPDGHYAPYSPMSGPGSAGTEPRRRPYSYAPATSATPVTPRSQPSQPPSIPSMKMPTPEPWNDPENPRRRQDADEAAINAYVRAVEQARKLQAGEEDDEEDEESVQRYMKAKFGDMGGNHSDNDNDNDNDNDLEEESSSGHLSPESESQSSSEMTESTMSDPRHPDDPYYRPDDAQSRASVPTIILNSPVCLLVHLSFYRY